MVKNKETEARNELCVLLVAARQRINSLPMKLSEIMWSLLETIDCDNPTCFAELDYSMVRLLYLAKTTSRMWMTKDAPEATAVMDGHGPVVDAGCHRELYLEHSLENTLRIWGVKMCTCLCG